MKVGVVDQGQVLCMVLREKWEVSQLLCVSDIPDCKY